MEQQLSGPQEPTPDLVSGQVEEGQAAEGQAYEAPEPEPFFSVKDGDKDVVFKTKDELQKAWKESHFRRSDYTKKTQELSQLRKQFEQRQKELEDKAKEFEKYDKFVQQRPDLYKRLQQELSRPPSGEVAYERSTKYVDEQVESLKKELEEFKGWKETQEREREKQEVYSKLREQYEDFDPDSIESFMQEVQEGGMPGVYEAFYHAMKGRENPIKTEQKIAENFKKKQKASTPGGGMPSKSGYTPKSLDEAHNLALSELE